MTESTDQTEIAGDHQRLWATVVLAHAHSLLRAAEARALQLTLAVALPRLQIALATADADVVQSLPNDLREALAVFDPATPSQYDAYLYVTPLTLLIYYTTLLDTFLQDTVEFLLFLHPNAIGNVEVSFREVLSASSHQDIVNKAVKRTVREVGFLSFAGRLAWLRKRFGLTITISQQTQAELLHYTDVRNTVVHDQGYFDFSIDDSGHICLIRRACPMHPTIVSYQDVTTAKAAFSDTAAAIAEAVFAQVLKNPPPSEIADLLQVLHASRG